MGCAIDKFVMYDFDVPKNPLTNLLAKDYEPPPLRVTDDGPADGKDTYKGTFIPIPVVALSPNQGATGGLLPVTLFREYRRMTNIFAPWFVYNEVDGFEGMFRVRRYPDKYSEFFLDAGSATGGKKPGCRTCPRYVDTLTIFVQRIWGFAFAAIGGAAVIVCCYGTKEGQGRSHAAAGLRSRPDESVMV